MSWLELILVFTALTTATLGSPSIADPCAKVAGHQYSHPADVRACLNSFPFNQTVFENVLDVHERVLNFYTFEDYYLNSPPPFQESTANIRAELNRIRNTKYATDYAFNHDLYSFTTRLNDGHTRWFPLCYAQVWQNVLPAPIVSLADQNGVQSVHIVPDSVEFLNQLGSNFTDFFKAADFNWQRLAGAEVLLINGLPPYNYVDHIASTVSGNYLDHGIRVNSVFSSYRIQANTLSQRLGDLAGPPLPDLDNLTMLVKVVGKTLPELVTIPYATQYLGKSFSDGPSYWATNCAANDDTNGVDFNAVQSLTQLNEPTLPRAMLARGEIIQTDTKEGVGINLPPPFFPTTPIVAGGEGVIQSYILPDNKTGVMFVGSFSPNTSLPGAGFPQFENDVVDSVNAFKAANVEQVLIDLSNNGGGFVCLGQFLHQYLAGSQIGYPGFVTSQRGNTLAQKIVANNIALNITDTFYSPVNWADLNDTEFILSHNYDDPVIPMTVNGVSDPTSQRFHDICTPFGVPIPATPPFPFSKLAIIGNANCASTCSMFSTLMVERHGVKTAVFGGKPGEQMEYKGMAGNQVLEWADLDSEIKTAQLKNDPLAPPDLLINGNLRHNWRTAWSFVNEQVPIAYVSEPAQFRFAYTNETYNNPQNLWMFAASKLF